MSTSSPTVLERLHQAMNKHDLEAFVSCFDPQYSSEQPAHPDRAFGGIEQVRKNWSALFSGIPDFRADLARSCRDDDSVWAEWEWRGTKADGARMLLRGVTIFGVEGDRVRWGRLYMEPIEEEGAGIDAAVQRVTGGRKSE